jgi:4'-phosphopantetheinyl transferase
MIIYYTHSFGNTEGESRRLLSRAIARYIARRDGADGELLRPDTADAEYRDKAGKLVSRIAAAGEFGKPYIPGFAPFSVSHSAGTWAVLIGDEDGGPCGLDIQYERKAEALPVAKRFYAPEDAALLESIAASEGASDEEVTDEFFRLWARREALIKAAGGSVAGTDAPSVQGDRAVYCGTGYVISDIVIPAEGRLYAAVCTEESADKLQTPVIIEL